MTENLTKAARIVDQHILGVGRVTVDAGAARIVEHPTRTDLVNVEIQSVTTQISGQTIVDDDVRFVGLSDLVPDPDGPVTIMVEVPNPEWTPNTLGKTLIAPTLKETRRYRRDIQEVIARELVWLTQHRARKHQ